MKVFKYNIDWQFARIKAKQEKNVTEKIKIIREFLKKYSSKENVDRALNWAEGTQIAYPKTRTDVHEQFDKFIEELESLNYPSKEKTRKTDWEDLKNYSEKEIYDLLKDLLSRNNKWLESGYINQEAVDFISGLFSYLQEKYPSEKLQGLLQRHEHLLKNAKFVPYKFKWKY